MWLYPIMAILFMQFDLLAPRDFQIIWLSNLSVFNIPDAGYYRKEPYVQDWIFTLSNEFLCNL